MIRVKPKKGVKVLRVTGTPIPPKGDSVQDISFYRRLIKDGDLEVVEPKKKEIKS